MKYIVFIALLSFALSGTAMAASMKGGHMNEHQNGQMAGNQMADGHMMGGQQMNNGGHGMSLSKMPEANREYMQAMDHMHDTMMEGVMDPDPDAAFVRGMIPHHRGALDMAILELKYGTDPELRELAQDIIDAQEAEIRFMEEWLRKKNAPVEVEE